MAAVGRVVHGVYGIQVGIASAISWCTGLRSVRAERVHVPRCSRSCGWQTVLMAHGRIRVCTSRCIWLGQCAHRAEVGCRRQVGGGVVCLRVGLHGHTMVGVASTTVGDGLRGVRSVRLGARIRTSAMTGMASIGSGHWCGDGTCG